MLTGAVTDYDIIIIGAGVLGTAAAYSLGNIGKKVLLIERDWKEPDRIVGELLQPGGVEALRQMNMEGIDGIAVYGYAVIKKDAEVVLPYPDVDINQGLSFHHGKFIMNLRAKAKSCANVTCLEATATDLLRCEYSERYIGVQVKTKQDGTTFAQKYFADLTVVADGCFSIFRKQFITKSIPVKSHFVGLVLKDCELPYPNHGHVVLADPSPILLYQIGTRDTRILVDIPAPLPSNGNGDLKRYMHDFVGEQLPESVKPSFYRALETDRLRSMPCSWLPPTQNTTEGVVILGDAQNMRHPLTGGGMTVAFWDVVHLRNMLVETDLSDTFEVQTKIESHHWRRKGLSAVVNVLANALYALFSAGKGSVLSQWPCSTTFSLLLYTQCIWYALAQSTSCPTISGKVWEYLDGTSLDYLIFTTPVEIFAFCVVGAYILAFLVMMIQLLRGWLEIPPSKVFYFVWTINIEACAYLIVIIFRQMDLLKVFVINSKIFTVERVTMMQIGYFVFLFVSCGGLYVTVFYLGYERPEIIEVWHKWGYMLFTVTCITYESFHAIYVSRAVIAQANRKRALQLTGGSLTRAVFNELYYLTLMGILIDWTAGILWIVGWFATGRTATAIAALSSAIGMGHCLFLTLTFKRIKKVNIKKIKGTDGTGTANQDASGSVSEKNVTLISR
ncbi:hypothetical protein HDV01_002297 [Terramyces sp. JEL0728]|nr:hypothetical protein HDV01_002297 [Terramyces sp. JEL0728]